ncbi:hypothetical protein AB8896_02840 [Yersinia enterocolitica]|jgi:hypothetical protein|uniref:hypothetical protein n=1 Tax=Yersinia enterocolitica TaxID=630 RepID=UPI0005E73BA5|nr:MULTISPECIES: hypothetical protein [Enterobacterales]EKN3396366.1 hypothetical protein [Yersinia enterocolitica]EKN3834248.1 hypothetical protein [Yersinia enterocolitica]ELI8317575.1 hypothetical protein [Yersinia enterocolitica]ELI8318531.1 hypothetical protein [Yersinia enterocolitica]ELW7352743.1 hypothetical protein [Yersinia enterocolitica]
MRNPNANLLGMLRLIPASRNTLAPIFEAITNSLESILERKSTKKQCISVKFHFKNIDEEWKHLDHIVISDTGAGFNTVSYERFAAILDSSKGYHNRGTGRLQFLHRFSQLSVVSQYVENSESYVRTFKSSNENFIFDERLAPSDSKEFLTKITLQGFKPQKKDHEYFNSLTLKKFESLIKSQYALRVYLEKQKNIIFPDLKLQFEYSVSSESETVYLTPDLFPEPCQSGLFTVPYCYPRQNEKANNGVEWIRDSGKEPEMFKWLVFEFDAESIESHGAFLCSKDIPVEHIKNPVVNNANGLKGKKKIAAFYGDYLDHPNNVNDAVDSFIIKSKSEVSQISTFLFDDDSYVYMDDIKKEVGIQLDNIYEELVDAKEATSKRVMLLAQELGVSAKIAEIVKGRIKLNAPDEVIIKSLHVELANTIADKSNKARAIIKQLDKLNPTADDYQVQIESKSKEISLLVDEQNKEELSKYVVRREIIAKLLDKIVSNKLDIQNEGLPAGKRKDKEGIIHDLFFKRKTSSAINDLWILDEEFLYYQGFSEMELSKITLPDGTPLLRQEAYEAMAKEGFKPNQRPDVYLYAGEGKCILLEFKAQDVDLSDYLQQMPKYCNLLANYANVKLEKFYCYLIGEKISPISSLNDYEHSVTGSWYRDSIPVRSTDLTNRQTIANIRMEILKLSDISARARLRNISFAEKLGLQKIL